MGDFYQFAPVRETSLLVNRMLESALGPLRQALDPANPRFKSI